MKRWWLVIGLLLSVGVNLGVLGALATGRIGHSGPRRHFDPFEGRMGDGRGLTRGVGLDEETAASFRELHQRFFERAQVRRRESMDLRHQLLSEVTADEPDRERIEEILQELGRADIELERAMVEATLESRELLGPEEERRYLELMAQRMQHMRGPPPGMGPGAIGRHGMPGRGRQGRRGPD